MAICHIKVHPAVFVMANETIDGGVFGLYTAVRGAFGSKNSESKIQRSYMGG